MGIFAAKNSGLFLAVFLLAAGALFVDGVSVGVPASLGRVGATNCLFPRAMVWAAYRDGHWVFATEQGVAASDEPMSMIEFYQRRTSLGAWATSSITTLDWVRDSGDVAGQHPLDFLTALDKWLSATPEGSSVNPAALSVVRRLISTKTPYSSPGFQVYAHAPVLSGVIHNAVAMLVAGIGLVSAVMWLGCVVAGRRAAARERAHQCPVCSYDTRGLREARCPECGGTVNPCAAGV